MPRGCVSCIASSFPRPSTVAYDYDVILGSSSKHPGEVRMSSNINDPLTSINRALSPSRNVNGHEKECKDIHSWSAH